MNATSRSLDHLDCMKTIRLISTSTRFLASVLGFLVTVACSQTTDPLPAPTGPHKTGRMSFHWKDPARDELETRAPDDKRELMVHLFYPADASASGARATYVPDADAMRGP